MMQDESYRPIELARSAGISAASVRSYEALGFIPPAERRPSGHRIYRIYHWRALETARALIGAYGWLPALEIMQAVHRDDLPAALATIDRVHAGRDRERAELLAAANGVRHLVTAGDLTVPKGHPLRIGEVAAELGILTSAIRFWEAQGVVVPMREPNRYRRYDAAGVRDLRVVCVLRGARFGFPEIRRILDELRNARPESALAAIAERERGLDRVTLRCLEANAHLWNYLDLTGRTPRS